MLTLHENIPPHVFVPPTPAWDEQTTKPAPESDHSFLVSDPMDDLEGEFRIALAELAPNANEQAIASRLMEIVREFLDGVDIGELRPSAMRAELVARMASAIIADEDVRLNARALALATGIGASVGLGSAAAVGRELGVTRAAVTKRANAWSDLLGIRPLNFLRSQATRARCAAAQRTNHWRKRL
jgi:hypothetical protein